jgi:hypothetical protein
MPQDCKGSQCNFWTSEESLQLKTFCQLQKVTLKVPNQGSWMSSDDASILEGTMNPLKEASATKMFFRR